MECWINCKYNKGLSKGMLYQLVGEVLNFGVGKKVCNSRFVRLTIMLVQVDIKSWNNMFVQLVDPTFYSKFAPSNTNIFTQHA